MILTQVIGTARDRRYAVKLQEIEHKGGIEYVTLNMLDTQRKRLRVESDRGTDYAIALPRETALEDGSILHLDQERAVIVKLSRQQWLRLRPKRITSALQMGYNAGNHHWRVKFDGVDILIALEGPRSDYIERLEALLSSGEVEIIADD